MTATSTRDPARQRSLRPAPLQVATGFVFLWTFVDMTFGFDYAARSSGAWFSGGSPTEGFLSSVAVGPFQSLFHSIAGTWWADTLFMLGLLGVGSAVIAGVAMRLAAVAGVVLLAMMWLAEFSMAQHTSAAGAPTSSSDPFVDYHVIYALVLVVLALASAGETWGLGRRWARLPFVPRHPDHPLTPGRVLGHGVAAGCSTCSSSARLGLQSPHRGCPGDTAFSGRTQARTGRAHRRTRLTGP